MTALNQNQFALQPIQGELDLRFNAQTIAVAIDTSSVGGLLPGQPVKVVDSVGGVPKVVECAANSDDVFGFINYNIKNKLFNAGDAAEISAFRGNVMYMTASGAIARNGKVAVAISLAAPTVVAATSGMMIVGRAFDKAVNVGDLIRVEIDLPGALA